MDDKDAIIALLRACIHMPPQKCQNTLKEALRQMDERKAEQALFKAKEEAQ